ncbi:hypothetical protein [Amycolatopsis sp. cmx-4-61]|uniref:hypothetical protein n=1 Tax=Amycolatopsis sp. cmx-4-61 TaxID=2790937 RepID=UPI00397DEA08
MNGPVGSAGDRRLAAGTAIAFVKELLTSWSAAHDVVLADLDEACEILWGTRYGVASLSHLSAGGEERTRRLAEQALRAILLGWRTGPPDEGS